MATVKFPISKFFLASAAIAAICCISAVAQNVRPPRPTPTPFVVPEIISRADDNVDNTTQKPADQRPVEPAGPQNRNAVRKQTTARPETRSDSVIARERLALNLDILTKAEQRTENLRKQLFDLIEKENTIKSRLDQIENDLRPEAIDRQIAITGSLRPEELRAQRRRSLEIEKQNLSNLLNEVVKARTAIETNLSRSEALVEKIRARLEKEIDTALDDADEPNQ